MNDRRCLRCGAVTPGRLVVKDPWGERCWGCGDVDSCVDVLADSRPGPGVARSGGTDEAPHAEVDPFRLASRLLRTRGWYNPAAYASLALASYRRYCELTAQRPSSDRDVLIALATRVFPGLHRRTIRRDIERPHAARAATR